MARNIDELTAAAAISGTDKVLLAQGDAELKRGAASALLAYVSANMPVEVVDSVVGTYALNVDITAVIPPDDTIPQIGEGTEIISVSITPKTATNRLRATFHGTGSTSAGQSIIAALFAAGGADALAADTVHTTAVDRPFPVGFIHQWTPGVTTAVTVAVRVGLNAAGILRMNGISTARRFGGVMRCTLVVEEIAA